MTQNAFSLAPLGGADGKTWVLTLSLPGEKVNKLDRTVLKEFPDILSKLAQLGSDKKCEALLFVSGKPDHFIAGADIALIASAKDSSEAEKLSREGQGFINRFEDLPFLKIACIEGAALGGGCEFALACDAILVSQSSAVKIGLPEVMLGLLPGMGGTIRLPERLGYAQALDMILSGKSLSADAAVKAGLADASLPKEDFRGNVEKWLATNLDRLMSARKHGKRLAREPKLGGMGGAAGKVLESVGRSVIFSKARSSVMERTHGKYPAPLEAISVIQEVSPPYQSQLRGEAREHAMEREAKAFGKLAATPESKNLIRLFFLTEEVKKSNGLPTGSPQPTKQEIRSSAVLGAGVMGGGIAQLFADRGIPIRVKDLNEKALEIGVQSAHAIFKKALKRRKITPRVMSQKMGMLSPQLNYQGFSSTDLVVEAVIEKMDVKKSVLSELEKETKPDAILATNTSSLSVSEMQTVLKHPERFLGMHFFNPVHKMPLIEVIRGSKTSDQATATLFDLCKKLGKTPIVVRDGPGFLVNRLLAPYLNEASYLVMEGVALEKVDQVLLEFGMPMGPMELIDEVGVDVADKVAHILEAAFGSRMKSATLAGKLLKEGRLGKKNQKGLYRYTPKKESDASVPGVLGVTPSKSLVTDQEILDRCVLPMINEAALCLEEGIVLKASDVDVGMIFGTGFPPFRGGLLRYADQLGADTIVTRLKEFESKLGERFRPSKPLEERGRSRRFFHE